MNVRLRANVANIKAHRLPNDGYANIPDTAWIAP